MAAQDQMAAAKQAMQKALQTFPTNRAVQVLNKDLYATILLQVRAVAASKTDPRARRSLTPDITNLERVVGIKTDYIGFLDSHMAAFQAGLAAGAKPVDGKAMHWDAAALIEYVEQDGEVYGKAVEEFEAKWRKAIRRVNPLWVETFGPNAKKEDGLGEDLEEVEVKEEEGEAANDDDKEKKGPKK
ncbi:hypothetical protein BDW02DRAFT_577677 [Decorospora gaudefroyi]|uniref:Uncharacterized protein n=1 Tax=Decorospora gaudefroyi TaxID=184978 RepID=A0A6A5KSZ9_9PLEO|nr:hypothetical protein BDW02DRAFT_577677 [Decorospora gaudefroyi]